MNDKTFLFTIEQIQKIKFGNNVLYSKIDYISNIMMSYLKTYGKGVLIFTTGQRIWKKDIINIETIPNLKESLKFYKAMLQKTKKEILIILASSSAFFRIETNVGYNTLEELSYHNIKVKVLIPLKIELKDQINYIKANIQELKLEHYKDIWNLLLG